MRRRAAIEGGYTGVSDLYVVRYLLQATGNSQAPLLWQAIDAGSYTSELNGVRLSLFRARTLGWSGLCLAFSSGGDTMCVEEPRPFGLFGRRYRSDDERSLADALSGLARAVATQCFEREVRSRDLREVIREGIYHRVLFGGPS